MLCTLPAIVARVSAIIYITQNKFYHLIRLNFETPVAPDAEASKEEVAAAARLVIKLRDSKLT